MRVLPLSRHTRVANSDAVLHVNNDLGGHGGAGGEGQNSTSILCIIWTFSFYLKYQVGGGVFSPPLSLHFHFFHFIFCVFIRKQGWRWKQTLNELLSRILQSLQRLLRRLGENGFLPQFCTDENKRFLSVQTGNTERMRAGNAFTPRHAKNGACHSE